MTVWLARRRATAPAISAEAVLAALGDALLVVDAEDVVRDVNPAAEALFNVAAAGLRGRPLGAFVRFDSPLLAAAGRARALLATVALGEVTLALGPGRAQPVEVHAGAIAERPGWVVLSLRDRALTRRLDQRRSSAETGRTVATVAAALAHEVKNPLSGIRGAAQLIEASGVESELARLIMREVDRVCRLVERMDAFADDAPLAREAVNVHEVLDHVRRLAETGFARHVRFVERYDPSLPAVPGDRDRLVQVFLNLVKNAAEALPPGGGEIGLATAFERAGPVEGGGGALAVTVEDNGPGIPSHLRARIFEPFVTAKRGGGGLGLALVAKLVADHGGVIEVESEPRRTLFRVLLPLVEARRR